MSASCTVWLHRLVLSGAVALGSVGAQGNEFASGSPVDRPVSPEALRELPAQSDARGRLMPLQAASVLGWTCADPDLRSQIGTDVKGCYQAVAPGIAACRAQLQAAPPVGRRQATASQPDITTFRVRLRDCLREQLSERRLEADNPVELPPTTTLDPLAPGLGMP